ncbi:hypothetical protein FHR31_000323 [Parvibacter caecicola]|uniref:Uncharacterized protein n=1 Tax=Parvibacter caecicola TaxID=747645 RepID=A0A7W5D0A7_9ACTN|nr:hypothetical protein [Parvibacter caecicola]
MLFYSAPTQASSCIKIGAMESCIALGAVPIEPEV